MNQRSELRFERIARFYDCLDQFEEKVGGLYSFSEDLNRLPGKGVEFYFEEGEFRTKSNKLRVVRIGASKKIINRLSNRHMGNNAEKSIFRKHIGRALLNEQEGLQDLNYENISNFNIDSLIDENEVSKYLRFNIRFLILRVNDKSTRKFIKNTAISLLSNYSTPNQVNPPTDEWLGNDSIDTDGYPYLEIRNSGLWNKKHVKSTNVNRQEEFLRELENIVKEYKHDN